VTLPTAATRLIALLGDPVGHSLSPQFQNAAFQETHVDGIYLALRCTEDTLVSLMRGIATAGGAGNITLPHKERAAQALDRASEAVQQTGACNTFWAEDGQLCGDNTDVAGFRGSVRSLMGDPAGARTLLLGAGGVARAALYGLLLDQVDAVVLLNRNAERAAALQAALDPEGERVRVAANEEQIASERFDVVINATALGLREGDPVPLELERGQPVGAVLDLVYTDRQTAWVRKARALGIPAADGIEMLLRQGAAAFERWWDRPAPLDVMRRSLADIG
jgi:shikimate dehydrogenase